MHLEFTPEFTLQMFRNTETPFSEVYVLVIALQLSISALHRKNLFRRVSYVFQGHCISGRKFLCLFESMADVAKQMIALFTM